MIATSTIQYIIFDQKQEQLFDKKKKGEVHQTHFSVQMLAKKNEIDNFESKKEKNKTQKELTFSNEMHIILGKIKNKNPISLEKQEKSCFSAQN